VLRSSHRTDCYLVIAWELELPDDAASPQSLILWATPVQGARSIVQKEGIGGLYHGLLPTLLRDVPDIAIQFTLYERLRRVLERRRNVTKLRTWEHLILGGFSGVAHTPGHASAAPPNH